jgi:uncharacterized repeat protein (TIGR03803 family)
MRNRILNEMGGATLILVALLLPQSAQAQTFNLIYTFTGGADGATPFANLLLSDGIFYGVTGGGGAYKAGTVFSVNATTHAQTVLHSFAGLDDGAAPLAGLIQDTAGNLYGVCYGGGAYLDGTVFKLSTAGTGFSLLHTFLGGPTDGSGPAGTLFMNHAGDLFGTTYTGGDTTGWGTTFEISAAGGYTTGQSFSPGGALPRAGLVLEEDNLYGTTYGGALRLFGGTIFEAGVSLALYTFSGGPDGSQPYAALIGDGAGNLYGTAATGGDGSFGNGHGVVFEYNIASGQETVLYTFTGPDGAAPAGSLVRDPVGNLFGTTLGGGASGQGTVFELNTLGTLTTLYSFTGGADGANPFAGLVLDPSGNLWGVTTAGGSGYGTVFEITGVSPCIKACDLPIL